MYKTIRYFFTKNSLIITLLAFFLLLPILGFISYLLSTQQDNGNFIISILYNLVNNAISVVIFGLIWQIFEKRFFASDIFDLANLSNNLVTAGISQYYDSFQDIDWKDQFLESKNLDMFFAYAITFSKNNRKRLHDAKESGMKIRVFYPNYESQVILDELDYRFSKPLGERITHLKITESIQFYKELGAEIYIFEGNILSSYYLFDNIAYISFFNHKKTQDSVPCFEVKKNGLLFNYISNEIKEIKERSTVL